MVNRQSPPCALVRVNMLVKAKERKVLSRVDGFMRNQLLTNIKQRKATQNKLQWTLTLVERKER